MLKRQPIIMRGEIVASDRAYIDYAKFEDLTSRGVIYVTKMRKNLVYNTLSDIMYIAPNGLMQERVQIVEFTKRTKETGEIYAILSYSGQQ